MFDKKRTVIKLINKIIIMLFYSNINKYSNNIYNNN